MNLLKVPVQSTRIKADVRKFFPKDFLGSREMPQQEMLLVDEGRDMTRLGGIDECKF